MDSCKKCDESVVVVNKLIKLSFALRQFSRTKVLMTIIPGTINDMYAIAVVRVIFTIMF